LRYAAPSAAMAPGRCRVPREASAAAVSFGMLVKVRDRSGLPVTSLIPAMRVGMTPTPGNRMGSVVVDPDVTPPNAGAAPAGSLLACMIRSGAAAGLNGGALGAL